MAFCNFTTNAQPGTSPTEFTVDVENEIAESNEDNNLSTPTLTIAAPDNGGGGGGGNASLPDLVIDTFELPQPTPGQAFSPRVIVANQGNAAAGIFTIRLKFNQNTGLPDCNWDVPGLAAGGNTLLDYCSRTTIEAPCNYRTELRLDVEGEIAESNKDNNASNQPLTVAAP